MLFYGPFKALDYHYTAVILALVMPKPVNQSFAPRLYTKAVTFSMEEHMHTKSFKLVSLQFWLIFNASTCLYIKYIYLILHSSVSTGAVLIYGWE